MKTQLIPGPVALALALLTILNPQLSTCYAQGSLTPPPGAPAPTMKSLAQIEPRTAITNSGAVTISAAGSYYLTTNITVSSGDAITLTAGNVTLDLNGFTISSTAPAAGGIGAGYELKERGETMEIWATDKLLPFESWRQNRSPDFGPRLIEDQWPELLRARKLFPLLATLRSENGEERLRFEVKSITPEKIKDPEGKLFQPPPDYHEMKPLPF